MSGKEVHTTEADQGEFIAQLVDLGKDVLRPQRVFALARLNFHQTHIGVQAVEPDLRSEGVRIAGERALLGEDLHAPALGAIERYQQEVQVAGELVHHHHLLFQGTHHAGRAGGEFLVVAVPRVLRMEVALHAVLGPIVQLLLQRGSSALGLQAKRVAGEVDDVAARSLPRA